QAVAAFSPNLSWQTDGAVRAIAFAHGVIYIGGQFSAVRPPGTAVGSGRSVARSNVAALDATTGAPLNWHPRVGGTVYSLAVSGSRVYLCGAVTSVRVRSPPRRVRERPRGGARPSRGRLDRRRAHRVEPARGLDGERRPGRS